MAGAMLAAILGNLSPRVKQVPGNLISFSQARYADVWQAGMSTQGWVYMPQYCRASECRVHVALHGCYQYYDNVGDLFVRETGINEWAESNNIIVIYPQVIDTVENYRGCWDFWGFIDNNFAFQSGLQMKAVMPWHKNHPMLIGHEIRLRKFYMQIINIFNNIYLIIIYTALFLLSLPSKYHS